MNNDLPKDEEEALLRYANGEKPTFSTGICGSLTCGYGNLSEFGYWQYPLYPAEDYLTNVAEGWCTLTDRRT